ncbi:ABC transporter permease [Thalassotalea sp. PLHSN55]|uniref:ABC transporter permease n=1 Tax=Thalassotalea sp. PLHSN55 TaxID=3435888 RepID=UPI003F85A191
MMTIVNSSNSWVRQSLRLLHHELRRGELTIIFLAIVLAVATVFSLSGFTGQVKQAILTSSTNTIAADQVLRSSREVPIDVIKESEQQGLTLAKKIETNSMAFAGEEMLLTELSAVSKGYPLRGKLKVKTSLSQQVAQEATAPAAGKVWVEPSILGRMQVNIGDEIELGFAKFVIAGVVTDIPDRSFRVWVSGPTIILNIDDMAKTELIQPASRVTYKYLFTGEREDIDAFGTWLKPQLNEAQRWYDAKRSQNRLANIVTTAEEFLSLASMLGIVLAAVAVSVASRRYGQRHQSTVAVFKALGASQSHVQKLYCLHWSLLSAISIGVGLVLGYILLLLGTAAIESYLSLDETTLGFTPFITAIFTGLLCSLAFAVEPLSKLVNTSPLAVIRGFSKSNTLTFSLKQTLPLLALFTLLFIFSRDLIMSVSLLLGGLCVSMVLLLVGRIFMNAGRSIGSKAGKSWHLALANLRRRANENSVQLVSFTIAIKLLLLITVIKGSILSDWQEQFPESTPNHYLINVASNEVQPLAEYAQDNAISNQGFYPIYRGRLSAINGEKTIRTSPSEQDAQQTDDEQNSEQTQGRRGIGRELSLTWLGDKPEDNQIVAGTWWQLADNKPQVSIESTIAERLDIVMGDKLTFDLGGVSFSVPVTSIREVNWQSRKLNFYMIFNEAALTQFTSTSVSAWMVPEQQKSQVYQFLSQFPTISVMDFGAIMKQIEQMIEQISIAIELILILVVLAGSLVLVAQVQSSMEERERELAILRTLGAKGALLRNSTLFEFVALGAIAGLMASIAMEIAVFFLHTQVFNMPASFHFQYWLVGIGAGASFVGLVGMLSCWRLLNLSSVTLIRRTM